jgi:hypothetical protein
MAKIVAPDEFQIQSLSRTQAVTIGNLMAAGAGTAWEDRGWGLIPAFIKTCIQSLTQPAALWLKIRRPETTGDARSFATACGLMWGLGWITTSAILFYRIPYFTGQKPVAGELLVETKNWWLFGFLSLLQLIAATYAAGILLRLGSSMYKKMADAELTRTPPPDSLVYNILAYCLGPSLLALIPFVGIPLALLGSTFLFMKAGKTRLNMRQQGSITIALLMAAVVWGLVIVLYLSGWFVSTKLDFLQCYELYVPVKS